jgi:hypothetical protein
MHGTKNCVKGSGSAWRTLIIAYSLPTIKCQASFKSRFLKRASCLIDFEDTCTSPCPKI